MRRRRGQRGAALLVVMVVVMVVTILALGFLERSDLELACGTNTALKAQIEYTALGGLTWGRAMVLSWPGMTFSPMTRQSFEAGTDAYYDLTIDAAQLLEGGGVDPNTYRRDILCTAYKEASGGERVAETRVRGRLQYNTDTGEGFYVFIRRED